MGSEAFAAGLEGTFPGEPLPCGPTWCRRDSHAGTRRLVVDAALHLNYAYVFALSASLRLRPEKRNKEAARSGRVEVLRTQGRRGKAVPSRPEAADSSAEPASRSSGAGRGVVARALPLRWWLTDGRRGDIAGMR